jgi:uncharacterized protein YndB with AHSA1/START domain
MPEYVNLTTPESVAMTYGPAWDWKSSPPPELMVMLLLNALLVPSTTATLAFAAGEEGRVTVLVEVLESTTSIWPAAGEWVVVAVPSATVRGELVVTTEAHEEPSQ